MSVLKPVKTSLPALPAGIQPDLRMYLERVREELSRVQGGSSSTTIINNSSGTGSAGGGGVDPTTLPCGAPVTPTTPTGMAVWGTFAGYLVSWDLPTYCGHSHTEIYAIQDSAALGTEVLVGTSGGTTFSLGEPLPNVRRCFWIKHVNLVGLKGPLNATEGTCAVTVLDPGALLDALTGQITASQLYKDLGEQIDLIPILESGFIDERISRETADGVLTQEVTQVAAVAAGSAAAVTEIQTARIGYCTKNGSTTADGNRADCEANGGVWNIGLPWASAVKQVAVRTEDKCYLDGTLRTGYTEATCVAATGVDGKKGVWIPKNYAAIEQLFDALQLTDGGLRAQYTVKIDAGGHIAGFGLAVEDPKDENPTSAFGVRADRFWVAPPTTASATAPTTGNYKGRVWLNTTNNLVYYYAKGVPGVPDGWYNDTKYAAIPFVIQTGETIIDGITVPAGVYMDSAFVRNLSANKITAGSIGVQQCIGSAALAADQTPLWQICGNGAATFRNITIKDNNGQILLSSGTGISVPGTNLVPNSALGSAADEEPWTATKPLGTGSLTVAVNPGWPTRPSGVNAIGLVKSGTTGDPVLLSSGPFAVLAGSRYEAFGNVVVLNCDASLRVYWYDKDDNFLSYSSLTPATLPRQTLPLTDFANWPRAEGFVVAPSGAASARLKVYSDALDAGTTQGNVVLARPFMGSALPTQSAFSTWSPTYFAPIGPGNRTTYIRDATIDNAAIKNLSADKILAGNIAASEYVAIGQDVPPSASAPARNFGLYLDGPSRALWARAGSGSNYATRVRLGYIKTYGGVEKYGLFIRGENGRVVFSSCGTEGLSGELDGNGDPIYITPDCYIDSAYIRNLKTSSVAPGGQFSDVDVVSGSGTGAGFLPVGETSLLGSASLTTPEGASGVAITMSVVVSAVGTYSYVDGQPIPTYNVAFRIYRAGTALVNQTIAVPVVGNQCYTFTVKSTTVGTFQYTSRIYVANANRVKVGHNSLSVTVLKR